MKSKCLTDAFAFKLMLGVFDRNKWVPICTLIHGFRSSLIRELVVLCGFDAFRNFFLAETHIFVIIC